MVQIRGFTEIVADTAVRYQITVMERSVFLWVQQVDVNGSGMNKMGSMSSLAAAMPGAIGSDGLPAAAAVLGNRENAASERFASRIARRCNVPVYASIDLGDTEDVAADLVFGRVVRELESIGVGTTQ